MIATLLAGFSLAAVQTQSLSSIETEYDIALGTIGMTTRTARFDSNILAFFGPTQFSTPFFRASHDNPWRLPYFAETFRREMGAAAGKPSDSLDVGLRLAGYGTRRNLIGSPIAYAEEIAKNPEGLTKVLNDLKSAGVIKTDIPSLANVPSEVQRAAALVLSVVSRSVAYRRMALKDLGSVEEAYLFLVANGRDDLEGENFDRLERMGKSVDLAYLGIAAHDIAQAATIARDSLAGIPAAVKYSFEVESIWGTIRLTGATDSAHPDKPMLLCIDTGGNDTYLNAPSTSSASNWASVVIDTAGNDKYLGDAVLATTEVATFAGRKLAGARPGPGGALLGVSVLLDGAGDDLYRSHRPSIGSGRFGFGIVVDKEGTDKFDSFADSQGFGFFGAGLLQDLDGDDTYLCFTQSQGVGLTRGFGQLLDVKGNDVYTANDTVIDVPSAQSDKHNNSMSQGAGYGRRGDYLDGHSWAGGVGILHDQSGDDTYSCAVFGQGVGYWEGVGCLWDELGKDSYTGQWYVQGASAHFAIGYCEDLAGDDTYSAGMNMAQGAGHDFSIGMLIDRSGADQYTAPNLSLGAGNANGIGLFVDVLGNDSYASSGVTLGKAAEATKLTIRGRGLCLGVFMDLAGDDRYPAAIEFAGDARKSANWTSKEPIANESQVGVFYDR